MNLWIRSQDKQKLLKITTLTYEKYSDEKNYFIYAEETYKIGEYATKERTLEVLDEIQNILNAFKRNDGKEGKYEDLDLSVKVNMLNYVYEMPKE